MSRVKFNVNTEYAYLQNFKILQSEPYSNFPFQMNWAKSLHFQRLLYQTSDRAPRPCRIAHQM